MPGPTGRRAHGHPDAGAGRDRGDCRAAAARGRGQGARAHHYDLDRYVYGALKAGAAGFLLKATPPDRLVSGVETVAAGEALLAPSLTRRLIEEHVRRPPPTDGVPSSVRALTERELEVLELIAHGMPNDEIAHTLVVAEATVKTHVNRILSKLALASRVQAVVLAYECGLVHPGDARFVPRPVRRTPPSTRRASWAAVARAGVGRRRPPHLAAQLEVQGGHQDRAATRVSSRTPRV